MVRVLLTLIGLSLTGVIYLTTGPWSGSADSAARSRRRASPSSTRRTPTPARRRQELALLREQSRSIEALRWALLEQSALLRDALLLMRAERHAPLTLKGGAPRAAGPVGIQARKDNGPRGPSPASVLPAPNAPSAHLAAIGSLKEQLGKIRTEISELKARHGIAAQLEWGDGADMKELNSKIAGAEASVQLRLKALDEKAGTLDPVELNRLREEVERQTAEVRALISRRDSTTQQWDLRSSHSASSGPGAAPAWLEELQAMEAAVEAQLTAEKLAYDAAVKAGTGTDK